MAGPGNTTAKDPEQRRRQNRPARARQVKADGVRGPELPVGVEWPAQTVVWWDNWRRSAQSAEFTATDWDFLVDTALLHAQFWHGDTSVGPELRLRVAKVGATAEDRKRLNIKVEDEQKPQGAGPTPGGGRYGHLRSVAGQ